MTKSVGVDARPPAQRPAARSRILRRILALLAGVVLSVLALEVILRISEPSVVPQGPARVELAESGERRVLLQQSEREALVASATPAAAAGVLRVVMVGDSTIWGTHLRDHSTIPRQLELLLHAATERSWEFLNLGYEGISARDVCALGEAALEHLSPDLVLVYTGHNEFLPPHIQSALAEEEEPSRARIDKLRRTSAIGRKLSGSRREIGSVAPSDELGRLRILERSRVAAIRPRVHETLQSRIEAVVRAGVARGVPVIVIGPTSAGREYGALCSAYSRPLSAQDRERFVTHLGAAVVARDAGNLEVWAAELDRAAAIDDQVAELLHQRAALHWARREEQAARRLDLEKWGLDETARAASLAVIERLEAAARTSGARFVAVGPQLERLPLEGEPRFFLDQVHPSVYGQYLIARQVVDPCAEALGVEVRATKLTYEQLCAALGLTPEFLELSELYSVRGDVSYACWAFDPSLYMQRARAVFDRTDERHLNKPELVVADLYLAILEGDVEHALDRAAVLGEIKGRYLRAAAKMTERLPRLRSGLERAGLEFHGKDSPVLRRIP